MPAPPGSQERGERPAASLWPDHIRTPHVAARERRGYRSQAPEEVGRRPALPPSGTVMSGDVISSAGHPPSLGNREMRRITGKEGLMPEVQATPACAMLVRMRKVFICIRLSPEKGSKQHQPKWLALSPFLLLKSVCYMNIAGSQ